MNKANTFLTIGLLLLIAKLGWSISASVNYAIYQDIEKAKTYIEVYTHIVGQSVVFVVTDDNINYQANLQSTIIIKQGDKIIDFKKYNLSSPLTTKNIDFSDLSRMYIPEGEYQLLVDIIDLNDEKNIFSSTTNISSRISNMSDIRLLSSITNSNEDIITVKNGVIMEALAYDRYFDHQSTLFSYLELYPDTTIKYSFLKYSISNSTDLVFEKIKRYKNKAIIPCLLNFDIKKLPSDYYTLTVKLMNKEEEILASKSIKFTRSNTQADLELAMNTSDLYHTSFVHDLDDDELDYFLKAIIPIGTSLERKVLSNAIEHQDQKIKRYALHEYWQRTTNKQHTKAQFNAYMKVAKAIDEKYYSGFGHGFESDRGNIFLKYGKPTNSIVVMNEPSAPPYEIWVYDYMEETHEHNVKFIFYSPSLSDDFLLLHSTCKNELSNHRWEHELYKNAPKDLIGNSIDGGGVKSNWNRKAMYHFKNL